MKKVGIFVKKGAPKALDFVRDLLTCMKGKNLKVYMESGPARALGLKGYRKQEIPAKVDVIIVFGGDGTLLSVTRLVGRRGVPILGVNLGGLGFITEISRDEICRDVGDILSGKCAYEERMMLQADLFRAGRRVKRYNVLNDVVINKSALARMIELEVRINGQDVTTFRSDGLIISTPTGSTAYSLSAGGPIMYPTLESFLVTPICPHTLTSRPMVLPGDAILDAVVRKGDDVYLTLDGQEGYALKVSDRISIRKADFKTRLLHLHDRDYFMILRNKLKWGEK